VNLADRRGLRLFTLCALYVAQGIPWGFMATTLPAYLTERDLDYGVVTAALSFTYLPYSFKWIWGPIIDLVQIPRFGRRRPWIVFAQAMMALTLIAMVTFDVTTEVKLLTWMIFIHTVFNALQDVAVDALAVSILDDEERGRANGLMYGCKYGGGLVGGYGMTMVISRANLDTALVVQTSILAAIMLLPLLLREPSAEPARTDVPRAAVHPDRSSPARDLANALGQAFSLRSALVAAVLMLAMNFANGMLAAIGYSLYITTLKWSSEDYNLLTGGIALAVGGVVAAGAGFIVDKLGRRTVAAIASCGLAAGWFAFSAMRGHWDSAALAWASGLWGQACTAMLSVALIALCMDLSWERVGGSQFTAYMALSNFSTVLGQQFSIQAKSLWSYEDLYIAAGVIQLAVTPLLLAIDPTELRRKLPLPRVNRVGIAAVLALLGFLIAMTIRASLKYL
jgi:MFS transporter, PAT family, beta-lactamase induction signal transducer AmpG